MASEVFTLRKPGAAPTKLENQATANAATLDNFKPRVIPGLGQVPLRPGEVMVASELRDLQPLGWHPGDPVPPEFAERLSAAREAIMADVRSGKLTGIDPNLPPLKIPQAIPIEKLPAAEQEGLKNLLAGYKQQLETAKTMEGLDPSLVSAIQQTQNGGAAQLGGFTLTDSRTQQQAKPPSPPPPPPPPLPPPPTPTPYAAAEALQQEGVDRAAAAYAQGKADSNTMPPAEGPPEKTNHGDCPRCGLNLAVPYAVQANEFDKASFLVAISGGQRMIQEVLLFGGRSRIILRKLTTEEADMIRHQLSVDQRDGRILNLVDMTAICADYLTALSIETIFIGDSRFPIGQAVDDIMRNPPDDAKVFDTPIPYILKGVRTQRPLNDVSIWSAALAAVQRFRELTAHLEANAQTPNFWPPIGV